MHKPCLSTGFYACESGADLLNLLHTKKVDLVLSGHGHEYEYERTRQLALSPGCPSLIPGAAADPDCISDSRADVAKGAGTVFVTAVTGGIAQRARDLADPEAPYFAAGSGLSTATWGVLDVQATATTLTASFARAAGDSFTDAFSIGPVGPPSNLPPTASFTSSCTLLGRAFDGSGSGDPEGTVASYAWDFGDSTSGTGATPPHTYATAGTYPVTLTYTAGTAITTLFEVSGTSPTTLRAKVWAATGAQPSAWPISTPTRRPVSRVPATPA